MSEHESAESELSTAAKVTNLALGCVGILALYLLFRLFDPREVPRKDALFVAMLYASALVPSWGWVRLVARHGFGSFAAWAWLIIALLVGLCSLFVLALLGVAPAH